MTQSQSQRHCGKCATGWRTPGSACASSTPRVRRCSTKAMAHDKTPRPPVAERSGILRYLRHNIGKHSRTWHDLERFSGSMLSTSSSPSSLLWGLEHHVCAKTWFCKPVRFRRLIEDCRRSRGHVSLYAS